jgi:hypothetical protein
VNDKERLDADDAVGAELAHLLRAFGAFQGEPIRMAQCVKRNVALGITRQAVAELEEYFAGLEQKGGLNSMGAYVASVMDTDKWRTLLEDVAYSKAARACRGSKRRKPSVNMPDPVLQRQQERRKLEEYIRERVNVDGKSPEFVAEHEGMSLAEVDAILKA